MSNVLDLEYLRIFTMDNIDLRDNWFTPDLEEDTRETPSHEPSIAPENNNKTLTSPQSEPHVQEIPDSKRDSESEVIECLVSAGVRNTSNLNNVGFYQ